VPLIDPPTTCADTRKGTVSSSAVNRRKNVFRMVRRKEGKVVS